MAQGAIPHTALCQLPYLGPGLGRGRNRLAKEREHAHSSCGSHARLPPPADSQVLFWLVPRCSPLSQVICYARKRLWKDPGCWKGPQAKVMVE